MNINKILLILLFLLLTIGIAYCNENSTEKRGWFWYEKIKPKEVKKKRKVIPDPPSISTMMKLHPDDVAKLVTDYHKQFVWKPTEKNAINYLKVQDVARKKSLAVSAVQQLAIKENPFFDTSKDYPLNKVGNTTYFDNRKKQITQRLSKEGSNFGLIFFSQKTCQYCPSQGNILRLFQDKYGWEIKHVDIKESKDIALRFNVTFTPTVLLIKRKTTFWKPIATGLSTLPEIEDAAYRTVRLITNEINPAQYFMMENERGNSFDPLSEN